MLRGDASKTWTAQTCFSSAKIRYPLDSRKCFSREFRLTRPATIAKFPFCHTSQLRLEDKRRSTESRRSWTQSMGNTQRAILCSCDFGQKARCTEFFLNFTDRVGRKSR